MPALSVELHNLIDNIFGVYMRCQNLEKRIMSEAVERMTDRIFKGALRVFGMVQPFLSVGICIYLLYLYGDILAKGAFPTLSNGDAVFLDGVATKRVITYAVVFLGFATLFEVGALVVHLLRMVPMSEGDTSKVLTFQAGFDRLTTPVLAATMLQLFAVHTFVSGKALLSDTNNGAAGILIWFESARALYDASKVKVFEEGGKWYQPMQGVKPSLAGVFLAGTALVYKLMQGEGMVHTWWFLLGTLVVYVGLGLRLFSDVPRLAGTAKSVMGVVLVYLSSLIFVETPTHANLVTVMLLVAGTVLSMSHEADDSQRLNAVWFEEHKMWQQGLRLLHIGVAVIAALALMDKNNPDKLLSALAWAGVFVKIVSSTLHPSQCEFLARNASTLMLLVPFAAMQTADPAVLQTLGFSFAVAARGVDALQNTKLSDNTLLGSVQKNLANIGNEVTNNARSPIPYAILVALCTAAAYIGIGFDGKWDAADWEPDMHTYLLVAFLLVIVHTALALLSVTLGTAKYLGAGFDDKWGNAVLSTLEVIRATVASSVIALLSIVVFQSTAGDQHALVAALMIYVFADIYGRNVV